MKPILFISDLHLSPDDQATATAFQTFLAGPATEAQALYILGDLFEYWIGDDQLDDPFFAEQAQAIRQLTKSGIPVFFLPGNRDFLPGRRFAQTAALTLLPDPYLLLQDSGPILLAHGDAYCTDDQNYQRFRRLIRHPLTRAIWFLMPHHWRLRKAAGLREKSRAEGPRKADYLMDVNCQTIEIAMQAAGTAILIHGHTHRPACHQHTLGIRWVLPDWHSGLGGYLHLAQSQFTLKTWPA